MRGTDFDLQKNPSDRGRKRNGSGINLYIKEQIEGREDALRKAVVICPGGAYAYVSDREADPVAMQFLAMDVQVFILNYSVAPHIFPESLLQLAAAVAYVRDHAAGWYIDPDEIGVLGFSPEAIWPPRSVYSGIVTFCPMP